MIDRRSWGAWALLVCGGLVGCAHTPAPPATWSGRLALSVLGDSPQTFSAGFDLQGNVQQGRFTLNTPLGTTLAHVRWSEHGAQWQRGDEWLEYRNLTALTTELMGTELPMDALLDWLQGQPTSVQGWTVDLSRHQQGRITAQRTWPLPRAELRLMLEP